MKNTKKITAAVMALAMVSALSPMSAFAADTEIKPGTNGTPDPSSAGLNVKYNYTIPDPTFTVTIPAGVELSDSADTKKAIKAKDIKNLEEKGKKIVVKLASASNDDDDDTTFHAKNGDSDATYTIKAGSNAVKVGDTVAEFKTNSTDEVSSELTFSKITLPANPVEGDYTETLTFGIAVEDAAYVPKTFTSLSNGDILRVGDTLEFTSGEYMFSNDGYRLIAWNAPFTVLRANLEGLDEPEAGITVTEDVNGAYYVIKGNENNYFDFDGRLAVTDTSDGVIITKNGSNWAINVYEP